MNKKKVLIVGSCAKEYALAKYLSKNNEIEKVYIAPGNVASGEFAERIDIRENDVQGLLEFAIKEEINLTIVPSQEAIRADIAGLFQANSQLIFAPSAESSKFAISRAAAKKFLYKLHIPTPKFGIFEKNSLALDYVKDSKMPILITADVDNENSVRSVCTTSELSKTFVNDLFLREEPRVVIEEYAYGHPFTVYVMTDGYCALPFAAVGDYKFMEDGGAGIFTRGMGAYVPDYKVSLDVVGNITENVVNPVIKNLEKRNCPYLGILGVECVLTGDNNYTVTGFTPFLKEHDTQAVLNSLDTDLYRLFEACAVGSFADDYTEIRVNDLSTVSCVLYARNTGAVITGLEMVDDSTEVTHFNTSKNNYFEYLTNKGRTLVLTQTASTLSRARELLYDNVEDIYFEGKKYRRDICAETV